MSDERGSRGERPQKVGPVLDEVLDRLGLKAELEDQRVLEEWEASVGEKIAGVARPRALHRGVLFVEVRSSAWLNELNLMKSELLDRLNRGGENQRVKKLVFTLEERS